MSGQIAGWLDAMRVMSRNPPAARRSITACSSVPWLATFMSVDAASCGTWLTTATMRVVQLGRHRDRLGAEVGDPRAHLGEHLGVGAAGRREHPGGADEQVGARAREALLLGTRHGVATHEARRELGARRLHRGDDRCLHRADVGHQGRAGVERLDHHLGDVADRHRDHGEVGAGHRLREVGRECVDRAGVERGGRALGVVVEAAHGTPARREREADRAADQAGADERDGLGSGHDARQSASAARSARNAAAPSRNTWCSWSRGRSE